MYIEISSDKNFMRNGRNLRDDGLKVSEKLREWNSFGRGRGWAIDVEDSKLGSRKLKSNRR